MQCYQREINVILHRSIRSSLRLYFVDIFDPFLYRFNTKSLYFCTKLRVRSDRKLHDDSRRIGIAFQTTFYLLQGGMVFVQKARRKPQIVTMHGVDHTFKHRPFSIQFDWSCPAGTFNIHRSTQRYPLATDTCTVVIRPSMHFRFQSNKLQNGIFVALVCKYSQSFCVLKTVQGFQDVVFAVLRIVFRVQLVLDSRKTPYKSSVLTWYHRLSVSVKSNLQSSTYLTSMTS